VYCTAPFIHKEIISPQEIAVSLIPGSWEQTVYSNHTKLEIYTDLPEEPRYEFPLVIKLPNQDN
jgi:hypothetical protein